jgi:hypothetical protein
MSSTFSALKTAVSRDIRDPGNDTFSTVDVGDLINAALAEVGRIAPYQFIEDITPIADVLAYQLQTGAFGDPTPEIQVTRVEVWDAAYTPHRILYTLLPASAAYVNSSAAGWEVWGGILYLNNDVEEFLEPARHVLRVKGYRPYKTLVGDGDVNSASPELEAAMRVYCRVEALQRLAFSRDMFTSWQVSSSNTNVTPASLMNSLSLAQADWERRSKKLAVLRVAS